MSLNTRSASAMSILPSFFSNATQSSTTFLSSFTPFTTL